MDDAERGAWLKQLSAAVEAKSFISKANSLRSFRAYDVAETAPKEYICPISLELMRDPVLLVESGQVYDRSSIEGWFKSGKSTCPVSGTKVRNMRLSPIFPLRSAIQSFAAAQNIELDMVESESDQEDCSLNSEVEFSGNIFEGVSVYDVKGLWQLVGESNTEQQASALRLLADMARFGDRYQKKHISRIIRMDAVVQIYKHSEGAFKIQAARLLLHLFSRYFDLKSQLQLLKLNSMLLREEVLLKVWNYCYRRRSRMLEVSSVLERHDTEEIITACKKLADPTDNSEISEESRACGTLLLACGAFRRRVRSVLINHEVVPLLVHFLNGTPNVGFRFCLMKAVQYICEDQNGRQQVLRAGGVRIFVMHLPPRNRGVHYSTRVFLDWFSWVTVAETAVKALYFLSMSQQGRTEMKTTATIKALRLIFNSSQFSDTARVRYLTPLLSRLASSSSRN
eukprot:g4733.t1